MIRVMTANTRFDGPEDGIHAWENRREDLAKLLNKCDADVICMQELDEHQEAYLSEKMPDYSAHGIPWMPEYPAGRHVVIFFRKNRFSLEAGGGFYLSETPHVPGSKMPGAAHVRIVASLSLKQRSTGHLYQVLNTHLDHLVDDNGIRVRAAQSRLLCEHAASFPIDRAQIICGDMKAAHDDESIMNLRAGWKEAFYEANGTWDSGLTYHQFQGDAYDDVIKTRLDYIFYRGPLQASTCEIVKTDLGEGRFASDHHFLLSELEYVL